MRRNDREITDRRAIDDIIRRSRVCRLGLCDGGQPYIVPMSFGYDGEALYFHAASQGRKIDVLTKNNRVCFEFYILHDVIRADRPCRWGMRYESVIGFGTAEHIWDLQAREKALACIMRQCGGLMDRSKRRRWRTRWSSGCGSMRSAAKHVCEIVAFLLPPP